MYIRYFNHILPHSPSPFPLPPHAHHHPRQNLFYILIIDFKGLESAYERTCSICISQSDLFCLI
jgi:hypothetical protein